MERSLKFILFILSFMISHEFALAQVDSVESFGQIVLVNRMDSTHVKQVRSDKTIKIRMTDGKRLEGKWYLSDEQTMVVGRQAIPMKDIYSIAGYVVRDSREKTLGAGLLIFSVMAAAYPSYLIFSGFALGQPHFVFVGATVIFLDLFVAYAGASLMGIYPRRFNRLNWDIRVDYPANTVYKLPGELPLLIRKK